MYENLNGNYQCSLHGNKGQLHAGLYSEEDRIKKGGSGYSTWYFLCPVYKSCVQHCPSKVKRDTN